MVLQLSELYSTKQAYEYVKDRARRGRGISYGAFVKHAGDKIVPIGIGNKAGDKEAHTNLFTRRMLDEYCVMNCPVQPNDDEMRQIVSVAEICEWTGLTSSTVKYHLTKDKSPLPGKKIGNAWVCLRPDVEKWMETL